MSDKVIPKVINYCWFGGGEKPQLLEKCIISWKKYCPDYEIVEWNESNFDVNILEYTKEAYKAKKYAFVSDVARLWIIYNYGGIYLDTDVELKAPIDDLLKYDAWLASDNINYVATGLGFGAKKHNSLIKAILDDYNDKRFCVDELITCVALNTKVIKNYLPAFEYADKTRVYENILIINHHDYGKYANHYYTATWADESIKKKHAKKHSKFYIKIKWGFFHFLLRPKMLKYLDTHNNIFTKLYSFFVYDFVACGLLHCCRIFKSGMKKKFKDKL